MMDSNTDFTEDLFEQFTLDLCTYSMPAELRPSTQEENVPIEIVSVGTYGQSVSGEELLAAAAADFTSQNSLDVTMFSGDNPLNSQNMLNTPLPTPNYCTPLVHPHNTDYEEFLTPLVSPAITPNFTDMYQFLDSNNEQYFTPLSSPALLPNTEHVNVFHKDANLPTSISQPPTEISSGTNSISITPAADLDATALPEPTLNMEAHVADELITNIQDPSILAQQLAQIEAKQQILRDQMKMSPLMSPTYQRSPLGLYSTGNQNPPPSPLAFNSTKKRTSLRQQIALASPQLHSTQHRLKPQSPTILPSRTPATPASLMKIGHPSITSLPPTDKKMVDAMPSLPPAAMSPAEPAVKKRKLAPISPSIPSSSPRTLRPLISPFLQPTTTTATTHSLSPSPSPSVENRRSAHKVAEQRRRDTLKQSFDSLRKEIVDVLIEDSGQPAESIKDEKEKEVKLMSKVLLLQHSYEYIVRLKTESQVKDDKIIEMQKEIEKLKQMAQDQKL